MEKIVPSCLCRDEATQRWERHRHLSLKAFDKKH
jgi:hypothetical protein